MCFFYRVTVAVKKEGWGSRIPGSLGGGLTRTLSFRLGTGSDLPILKPINKQQLGITIGPGLPKDSSESFKFVYFLFSSIIEYST